MCVALPCASSHMKCRHTGAISATAQWLVHCACHTAAAVLYCTDRYLSIWSLFVRCVCSVARATREAGDRRCHRGLAQRFIGACVCVCEWCVASCFACPVLADCLLTQKPSAPPAGAGGHNSGRIVFDRMEYSERKSVPARPAQVMSP